MSGIDLPAQPVDAPLILVVDGVGNGDYRPILLKNPVSASSENFLAAMRGFVISDMRGHKKYPGSRQRSSYRLIHKI
jgi:hypothetical protein